jgi:hypothetical protein
MVRPILYDIIVTKWVKRKELVDMSESLSEKGCQWAVTKATMGEHQGLFRLRRTGGKLPLEPFEDGEIVVNEGGGQRWGV